MPYVPCPRRETSRKGVPRMNLATEARCYFCRKPLAFNLWPGDFYACTECENTFPDAQDILREARITWAIEDVAQYVEPDYPTDY